VKNIEAILFDFDGVILESVDIKGWAFGKLFEGYPEHRDTIVSYHHDNGGVSRFRKFKYIYKDIIKKPLSDEDFNHLSNKYSELVFDKVINSPFVPGAKEFLEKHYKNIAFFIISGTPLEEMQQVVEAKGLSQYFQGVYGSPKDKVYWVKKILEDNQFQKSNVLFVGDAMSDYYAAKENGIAFIGRIHEGKANIFAEKDADSIVQELTNLDEVIFQI